MIDCFVETFVTFGFSDFDGRTNDDFRAVVFEFRDELAGLGSSARNDDCPSGERFRPVQARLEFRIRRLELH